MGIKNWLIWALGGRTTGQSQVIIHNAYISDGMIIIGDELESPIYTGCYFKNCKIRVRDISMMTAFAHCTFDPSCEINTKENS